MSDNDEIRNPVYMRVMVPERTYRRIKAAAALRGVGQGELVGQILDENVEAYLNFTE